MGQRLECFSFHSATQPSGPSDILSDIREMRFEMKERHERELV